MRWSRTLLRGAALALAATAPFSGHAALNYSWSGTGAIPDNDPTGLAFSFNLSGSAAPIANVTVSLDLAGGWNGDLYAYLSHGSGFSVLLDRVGMSSSNPDGYGNAGMDITLSGAVNTDIHAYQTLGPSYDGSGQLTGTWGADGRTVSPLGPPASFDAAPRNATLASFNGLDANGGWTIFFADLSPGDVMALSGFSVSVTTTASVPEPSGSGTLAGAGGLALSLWSCRRSRRKAGR